MEHQRNKRYYLAIELHRLLGIPMESYRSASNGHYREYPTKGTEIINAVIKVITDALLRGESIEVRGFGTFKVVTRKAHMRKHLYAYCKDFGSPAIPFPDATLVPAKKHVVFKPSHTLTASINLARGFPLTATEKRAIAAWR